MPTRRVSPEEALALMREEGYEYLDVRSVPEFEQGHPEGAWNVPLLHMGSAGSGPNPEFLDVVGRLFPRDAPLVVGCRTANRSEQAAALLERAGYTNLVIQAAGFAGASDDLGRLLPGWAQAGLPTSHEARPGRSWADVSGGKG
jgi:rhodanese-related sulfurtransferase